MEGLDIRLLETQIIQFNSLVLRASEEGVEAKSSLAVFDHPNPVVMEIHISGEAAFDGIVKLDSPSFISQE